MPSIYSLMVDQQVDLQRHQGRILMRVQPAKDPTAFDVPADYEVWFPSVLYVLNLLIT